MKKLISFAAAALVGACGTSTPQTPRFDVNASALLDGPFRDREDLGEAVDAEGARSIAERLLGGQALAIEFEVERGLDVYEVEVRRPSGSVVEIEIAAVNGGILEIESDEPVAGDDLDVGPDFLTLQQAIAAAAMVADGALSEWELEFEDDGRWVWEIGFAGVDDDEREVELDARTGAIRYDDDGAEPWDDDDAGEDDDEEDCDDEGDDLCPPHGSGGS